MSDPLTTVPRPKGFERFLFRLPIFLYQIHLGFLFGRRFLLLVHIGRKSGRPHQTVIEVVKSDPASNIYYVVSGWGEKSDWYQNIITHPNVMIQVKNSIHGAVAERVSFETGGKIMVEYFQLHPILLKTLARVMHYPYEGTENSARQFGESIPVIALQTRK
jgi:deazaflavin-dependent oxidoreductase (nitroreductase family)